MKNRRSFAQTAASLVFWGIITGGIVFILFLSRNTLLSLLAASSTDEITQQLRFQFIDKLFAIIGGITALSFCVVIQAILAKAHGWFQLLQKTFLLVGIEGIMISAFSLVTQIARSMFFQSWSLGLWVVVPLSIGGALIVMSVLMNRKKREPS